MNCSGGSGRPSPGMGLGSGKWDTNNPAMPPNDEGSPSDAPPRVTLTIGGMFAAAGSAKAAAVNAKAGELSDGQQDAGGGGATVQQQHSAAATTPPLGQAHSLPVPHDGARRLPALRAHSAAPWPASADPLAADPLAVFDLPALGLHDPLSGSQLGGGHNGSGRPGGPQLLIRPLSVESAELGSGDLFADLLPEGLELDPMDADMASVMSQPLPEDHRRLHERRDGATGQQRQFSPSPPRPQRAAAAGPWGPQHKTARRNSAPAPQWGGGGHGGGPIVGGDWAMRQPMHAAAPGGRMQREGAGAAAGAAGGNAAGGRQQQRQGAKPPAGPSRLYSGGAGRDGGGSEGGTPRSATDADIPQRKRSQRARGAKRTCVLSLQRPASKFTTALS